MKQLDKYDLIFLFGLAILTAGLYFAWPPLALIVPGGLLTFRGLVGDRST